MFQTPGVRSVMELMMASSCRTGEINCGHNYCTAKDCERNLPLSCRMGSTLDALHPLADSAPRATGVAGVRGRVPSVVIAELESELEAAHGSVAGGVRGAGRCCPGARPTPAHVRAGPAPAPVTQRPHPPSRPAGARGDRCPGSRARPTGGPCTPCSPPEVVSGWRPRRRTTSPACAATSSTGWTTNSSCIWPRRSRRVQAACDEPARLSGSDACAGPRAGAPRRTGGPARRRSPRPSAWPRPG